MIQLTKAFIKYSLLACLVISFGSCEKYKKGVLEIKKVKTQPSFTNGITVTNNYWAIVVDDDLYTPEKEFIYSTNPSLGEVETGYFWPNESAYSLGYKKNCSAEEYYTSEDECDSRNPGSNGHWKNDNNNGGGNGGNGVCGSGYVSPLDNPSIDIQLDVFCQQAYAYRCLDGKPLSDPGVQGACANYDYIKEPSAPACPYCQ